MIEWSSHDVDIDHRISLLPQGGANCYRWEFANWRKILQIDGQRIFQAETCMFSRLKVPNIFAKRFVIEYLNCE